MGHPVGEGPRGASKGRPLRAGGISFRGAPRTHPDRKGQIQLYPDIFMLASMLAGRMRGGVYFLSSFFLRQKPLLAFHLRTGGGCINASLSTVLGRVYT